MSYFECLSSVTVHFNPNFRLVCFLKLSRYSLPLYVKKMRVLTKWRLKTRKLCILLSLSSSLYFHQSVTLKHIQNIQDVQRHIRQATDIWAIKKKKKCLAKERNYFSLARRSSNSNVPNLKPRTEPVGHQNTYDYRKARVDNLSIIFFLNLRKLRGYASYQ